MAVGKSETGLAKIWVNLNLSDGILDAILFFFNTSEFLCKLHVLTLNYVVKLIFLRISFYFKDMSEKQLLK